jgi:60 kDa SS-A/Ro ribonucleoprotein
MARLNVSDTNRPRTHEGAPAAIINAEQMLRRSVLSCLLWEKEFYEDGQEIADRISLLAEQVSASSLSALAVEARTNFNLRHIPLLLTAVLAKRGGPVVADTIEKVIQRADELAEFLAIYARVNDVKPSALKAKLSNQVRKGLARAFRKFDEYSLAKYDRAGAVRLRDALFLCHAKPADEAQAALWKRLVDNELVTPDTWEVALSGGGDKKETFERLIREGSLGYLALLRNLRNMAEAGCDPALVRDAIVARKHGAHRVLPFRYVAAARAAPQFEPAIDQALCEAIAHLPILPGKTVVLVDVSGSMDAPLSARSDMKRIDAACALASLINGDVRMFSFSNSLVEVPPRRGMAGVDALIRSQHHGGTELFGAVAAINAQVPYDRLIVITDEQATGLSFSTSRLNAGSLEAPKGHGYVINVASAKNGVGYGQWVHIDGFSEAVLTFVGENERSRT